MTFLRIVKKDANLVRWIHFYSAEYQEQLKIKSKAEVGTEAVVEVVPVTAEGEGPHGGVVGEFQTEAPHALPSPYIGEVVGAVCIVDNGREVGVGREALAQFHAE